MPKITPATSDATREAEFLSLLTQVAECDMERVLAALVAVSEKTSATEPVA